MYMSNCKSKFAREMNFLVETFKIGSPSNIFMINSNYFKRNTVFSLQKCFESEAFIMQTIIVWFSIIIKSLYIIANLNFTENGFHFKYPSNIVKTFQFYVNNTKFKLDFC